MNASDDIDENDSFRRAMESVQADEAKHSQNLAFALMRQLLAGALCAGCGEPLGDDECELDDEGRTMHKPCIGKHDG